VVNVDSIIRELIQIESEADSRINGAREEMDRLDDEMRKKEAEIREDIERKTAGELKKLSESAEKEAEREILRIKQQTERAIADLEALYKQNRSRWEAEIVNQIIGS